VTALALALALAAAAPPGWRTDAPKVAEIDLPRFHVFATETAAPTAKLLAARLESDRDLLAERLGRDYPGLTEVRVGEGMDELVRLDVPDSATPRWAAGITHPSGNLILLDAVALRRDGGLALVRHELAHAALGQLGGPDLPRWFQEGFAVLEAGEWGAETDLALVRAARQQLPLSALEHGFPEGLSDLQLAYAESASFVEYLFEHRGADKVQALIRLCGSGVAFDAAFERAIGERSKVEADWLDSVKLRYTWIPVVTGSGTLFTVAALLCVAAYARRRRGQKLRMEELALEEQAHEAANRIRAAEERAVQQPERAEDVAAAASTKPTLH
jgi:hypothetical protein